MAYVKVLPVGSASHLKNILDYIANENKTIGQELVNCEQCTLEYAYRDFMAVKRMHGKPGGILAHQMIQSFEPGEISVEAAHRLGEELARKALPGYQYVVCTHVDREHIHNHILFNSVSYLTGLKYKGNKTSLRVMQAISDGICREHGLSVIRKSGRKGLDKITYQMAKEGKSWKAALAADLDDILPGCATKQEFVDRLEKLGYRVRYEKYITVTRQGEKKGIRLDTLAKQFGDEYSTENIERQLMGKDILVASPEKDEEVDWKETEWQRYERYHFETKKPTPNKKKAMAEDLRKLFSLERSIQNSRDPVKALIRYVYYRRLLNDPNRKARFENTKAYFANREKLKAKRVPVPLERKIGNVEYHTLVQTAGKNVTIKLPASKAALFEDAGIFYSGTIKLDGTVLITFKEINSERVSALLGVDLGKIYCYGEVLEQRMKLREMQLKSLNGQAKLYRYNLSYEQLKELNAHQVPFSYRRMPGQEKYAVFFFEEDLPKVCAAVQKDYLQERERFIQEDNRRRYSTLKMEAKVSGEKVLYRVVDRNGLALLQKGNMDMAYFPKGSSYNIAFLESDLVKYEQLIQNNPPEQKIEANR